MERLVTYQITLHCNHCNYKEITIAITLLKCSFVNFRKTKNSWAMKNIVLKNYPLHFLSLCVLFNFYHCITPTIFKLIIRRATMRKVHLLLEICKE